MTKDLSLLEQLENSGVKVDVDSYHLSWIKAVPFTPHDVTSNQIVIHQQISMEENKDIIEQTVREMKDKDWLDIHTVLVCRLISQWSAEDSY
jgi:transaldolase